MKPTRLITPKPALLAVPCVDVVHVACLPTLMSVPVSMPKGSDLMLETGVRSIAYKRNRAVANLLRKKSLHGVAFLDSDMIVPPDIFRHLQALDKDIAGCLYFQRLPPHSACWESLEGDNKFDIASTGLREVRRIGTGCVYIKRQVFEAMGRTDGWFHHADDKPGSGEDYQFCDEARALGFEVWLDFDPRIYHHASIPVDREYVARIGQHAWMDVGSLHVTQHDPSTDLL